MSTGAREVHTITAGDIDAAIAHGLTVKAACGLVFVPKTKRTTGLAQCSTCEEAAVEPPELSRVESMPHFVYRHYDDEGRLLYVGCTVDPKTRLLGHQQNSWWFSQSVRVRQTVYPNKLHALRVEQETIAAERPIWNVRHQDFSSWERSELRAVRDLAHKHEAPDVVLRRFRKLAGVA